MAEVIRCSDTGAECGFVVRAETQKELMELVAEHAQSVHGLEVAE